ncbi:hypothetical protein AVEN_215562-1 [Araneus ventricosus]|uniref:Uncharacterized protein n=1 Tax=Araneus ventricosus TaxID=182803 RepID=A0A4Y2BEX9_ARAVE|nr:hypothetical protein AVEN_215562-1 [Araneus ventricosus]
MRNCRINKLVLASPGGKIIVGIVLPSPVVVHTSYRWPGMSFRTPASVLELLQRLSFNLPGCLGRTGVTRFTFTCYPRSHYVVNLVDLPDLVDVPGCLGRRGVTYGYLLS